MNFQYYLTPSLGGKTNNHFYFLLNNRGFYISVNYSMWIDLGFIEILLLMKNMLLSLHYFNRNSSRLLLLVDKFF